MNYEISHILEQLLEEASLDSFYSFFRAGVSTAFKTITPWRKTAQESYGVHDEKSYCDGWNDCLKEIKKNRKNWLEEMDKKFAAEEENKKSSKALVEKYTEKLEKL